MLESGKVGSFDLVYLGMAGKHHDRLQTAAHFHGNACRGFGVQWLRTLMQICCTLPNVPACGMTTYRRRPLVSTSRIASAHPETAAFENNAMWPRVDVADGVGLKC